METGFDATGIVSEKAIERLAELTGGFGAQSVLEVPGRAGNGHVEGNRVDNATMSSRVPILSVEGLSKKYAPQFAQALAYGVTDIMGELLARNRAGVLRPGEFWALDDISFDLQPGQGLGVIGHNGAGKSTLLQILAGLLKPDRGSVRLHGRLRALLDLHSGLDLRLSGRENILLGAAVHGIPARDAKQFVDLVATFAELEEFIDAPVLTYSAGMRSRLGYALATQVESEILLVDEVLAVGDHQFQRKCINHMMGYKAAGGSLLLVSHNAHQLQTVCDRALMLHRGRLLFDGDAPEALQRLLDMQNKAEDVAEAVSPAAGPVRIDELVAENPDGDCPFFNQPMRLTLRYTCAESTPALWSFTIWTQDQWICVTGASNLTEQMLEPGSGELSCLVPRLPLLPGRYRIRTSLVDPRTRIALATGGPGGRYFDLEVRSPPDIHLNVRRQNGQLFRLDIEWQ